MSLRILKKCSSFLVKNPTSKFLSIRPSDNPIDAEGFEKMIS